MLLWLAFFSRKWAMPIVVSALMVFPVTWSEMTNGYKTMDKKLLEMAKCYSTPFNTILYVRLPHLFPFLISGISTSVGLAWKAGIAAEVICQPVHSIGEEISLARGNLDTEILFAWTVVVVILSILLETLLVGLLKNIHFRPRIRISDQYAQNGHSFPLSMSRIQKSYGEEKVLKDFTYHFSDGKIYAIMGASGCGKTTLLSIASGLTKDDENRYEMPPTAPGIIFQENRLIPSLTVSENILFANRGANIKRILKALSLTDDANKYPHELSGGMQRRVAIGRAMAFDGGIGIFDEPFTGLDEDTKALCAQALFAAYKGRTVLFVTHDAEDARRYADEILKM
jgi:NitT/TauT family transport system permease protein